MIQLHSLMSEKRMENLGCAWTIVNQIKVQWKKTMHNHVKMIFWKLYKATSTSKF